MHRTMCVSVCTRDCRLGGPKSCRRCPYRVPIEQREREWCQRGMHFWIEDGGLACGRGGCTARRATATYEDHVVVSGGVRPPR